MRQLSRQQAIQVTLRNLSEEGFFDAAWKTVKGTFGGDTSQPVNVKAAEDNPNFEQDKKKYLDSLPSKEQQRVDQDKTQRTYSNLETGINAAETGTRVAKGIVDVGLQTAAPGVGGLIATGVDLASAGAAHAMGQEDARNYALRSAGVNAVGAAAGGAAKLASTAVAKGIAQTAAAGDAAAATAVQNLAKKGIEKTTAGIGSQVMNAVATASSNSNRNTRTESYSNKRLKTIQEQVKRSISNLF